MIPSLPDNEIAAHCPGGDFSRLQQEHLNAKRILHAHSPLSNS
jgi:hypothetical protein